MNTKYFTIILTLLYLANCSLCSSQKLEKRTQAERDSLLILISTESIKLFGPEYYNYSISPTISEGTTRPKGDIKRFRNRAYYDVQFLYDTTKIRLEYKHAAIVRIWKDNGQPASVFFGNGVSVSISDETGKLFVNKFMKSNKKSNSEIILIPLKGNTEHGQIPLQQSRSKR